jgi:hypothetical protein
MSKQQRRDEALAGVQNRCPALVNAKRDYRERET